PVHIRAVPDIKRRAAVACTYANISRNGCLVEKPFPNVGLGQSIVRIRLGCIARTQGRAGVRVSGIGRTTNRADILVGLIQLTTGYSVGAAVGGAATRNVDDLPLVGGA